jgi:hypothetical protein
VDALSRTRRRGTPAMTDALRRRLVAAAGGALVAPLLRADTPPPLRRTVPPGLRLLFGDEFDDPDLARFNEDAVGGRAGAPAWRSRYRHPRRDIINGEKQVYVDPSVPGLGDRPLGIQPFSIRDGVLSITASRLEPAMADRLWGQRYASGAITTELTHWQQYGWFETRVRLPVGRGLWPAVWLLPKREAWPPEIDVFEASGSRPGEAIFTVHEADGRRGASSGWTRLPPSDPDGFVSFACHWTARRIAFHCQGRLMFEHHDHGLHEPMYLLANLAVGSRDPSWIPDPDAGTPFPARFDIDRIHAYGD